MKKYKADIVDVCKGKKSDSVNIQHHYCLLPFAYCLLFVVYCLLPAGCVYAASLSIETDYKLSGVSYSNLDYDTKTSSDAISYYTQRLRLGIGGKFAPGIEIYSRLQSLSVVGSSMGFSSPFIAWRDETPYPFRDGTPFVENLYLRMSDIFSRPIDITIGRQEIDFGDGLLSDNSAGLFALHTKIRYPKNFTGKFFTAKITENFAPGCDFDVYGMSLSYKLKNDMFEFVFLNESDHTGSDYKQGIISQRTSRIIKNFYGGIFNRTDEFGEYKVRIIKQGGEVVKRDGTAVPLDGVHWKLSGILKAKETKVGDVSAGLLVSMFSGDDTSDLGDKDGSFSPTLPRRFDGFDTLGYGKIFGASMNKSALALHHGYSGINTIGVLFECSPFYRWTFGINYYIFSASEHYFRPSKEVSSFEKLLGAKYSLGVEMNLYTKFIHSKYMSFFFGYFRYTPPKEVFYVKTEPISKYQLDIQTRF